MKDRHIRLKEIRRLIRSHRISSQETLLNHLHELGYGVTQATLSRDLRLLKVSKVSEGSHGYYYNLPSDEERRESEKSYLQDIWRGYVSIDFSGNLAVMRTLPAHADSVAIAFDNLGFDEVIGTIAGDDTVLLVLREGAGREVLMQKLRDKIPDLED